MKLFIPLAALSLSIILITSCAKKDNTGDGSAGASGSFIGRVKYQGNSIEVDRDNRLIRVLRDGTDTYKIEFFTGIPNITGVRFNQTNDSTWVSTDTTLLKDVKIEGKLLKINYQSNSQSWIVDNAVRK
ncbi:hypothetical protein [Sphingobacterium sp.]|uniref:hypothetical protein n=1 Tax=Sphingobacterium sp. TaxID=341027 RepID=UPI002586D589|nr:hypothetical protein [Sphingobacterium sp.]WET68425.1 MAG: hypothetical protein P0Y57_21535 [Sphingobacterium sp.]